MNNRWRIFLIVELVLTILICESIAVCGQQLSQNKQTDKAAELIKKLEENGDPVADFDLPEPTNPKEREIRIIKNKKYNNKTHIPTLDKMGVDILMGGSVDMGTEPAFPNKSDFIAIGKITSANAFVSEDKTAVFGEFNFQIIWPYKNTTNIPIKEKDEIILNRYGGKVRLSSDKLAYRGILGLNMPKLGGEYLMFLKYDAESQTYGIITGYQFKEEKIEALDGISMFGKLEERYSNYPTYNGMRTSDFIRLVISDIRQNNSK